MLPAMVLVAILTVRRDARTEFETFERAAARIMRRHGGVIERTIAVRGPTEASTYSEIHVVTFPDDHRFAAYRADPEMLALSDQRARVIVETKVFVGEEGPSY
jgi:uncharacterized protein (DUF1330 family)